MAGRSGRKKTPPVVSKAPPPRKMAREKMRAHVTPRVIEESHFILPYHPEQVQVQDNSVAVISPMDPLKENNQLIKKSIMFDLKKFGDPCTINL